MAFDGHQSTFGNSLFPTYQCQASLNVGGGNNGSVALPFFSIPSGSLQDSTSYIPWSHNDHDDPCELISSVQSNIKFRKPDNTACDGETELQGLVSNILDEADSQDSYYSEGSLPTCNSIWSPKTLRDELQQAKVQHSPTFPHNYVFHDAFSQAQGQSKVRDIGETFQHSNTLGTNQEWLFNLPNGDRDSYMRYPQKLPPGLPVPNIGNAYLPQIQQNKYDTISVNKDRGNSQPMNNFLDLSNVFRPQSEMNSPSFDPYCEDYYTQNITKTKSTEQLVPQDIDQLVSSFQSFVAGEQDSFHSRDFPNMHKPTLGMHHEDSIVEQWKITCPPLSAQPPPAIQTQKPLVGEFGTVQRGRNEGVRKQTFQRDAFQDPPGFSPQNTDYFQQPKPYSAFFNQKPNQYQNNMTMHRENIDMSINQYSKRHTQQGQIQNKIKPQLQKDKKMMHMSGFLTDGLAERRLSNTNAREGEKKQALSQNPYFDLQGSMQSQKFDRENSIIGTGNMHQFMPLMYSLNDPRMQPSIPIKSNFSSRGTLPYGSGVPGMDVGDMVSASECAAFSSYVNDMTIRRQESAHHGMASAVKSPVVITQEEPAIQLYFFLDECYEQWRCLEKERKKIEVILTKTFPGKRTAAVFNSNQPRTPPNPSRVDHLIVKQIREKAKVANLLDRMEYLCNIPLHRNIHMALDRHHMAICITQARRKEETAKMSKRQQHRAPFTDNRETLLLVFALKDLAATTKKLRTALWCALQLTLPKPVKRQDHHVEATCSERCSSPFEGYFFRL